tara:strand:- start:74 stop:769 length:696 start_codon:yes stop_codon:yes gene_type:complete
MTNWEKSKILFNSARINTAELPEDHYTHLKAIAEQARKEGITYNKDLAGLIKEEYQIPNIGEDIFNFLSKTLYEQPFIEQWKVINVNTVTTPITLSSCWVNFQKKYEFNPLHNHTGFASFIIFLNIPYDLEEENKVFPPASFDHGNPNSKLVFAGHSPVNGGIEVMAIPVDKSFEGKMLMFDAKHFHMVYPFYTSDKERVTISGNFQFFTGANDAKKTIKETTNINIIGKN